MAWESRSSVAGNNLAFLTHRGPAGRRGTGAARAKLVITAKKKKKHREGRELHTHTHADICST